MLKYGIAILTLSILGACSPPMFIGDAEPVPVVAQAPDHFVLPARFATVRTVYGGIQPASGKEAELWEGLIERSESLGFFAPLVSEQTSVFPRDHQAMLEVARNQRFNYLLLTEMDPATGAADIKVYHVGSGGLMATAQAVSESGGRNGFWGGPINNPGRLERTTLEIARAAVPVTDELLRGMLVRQR